MNQKNSHQNEKLLRFSNKNVKLPTQRRNRSLNASTAEFYEDTDPKHPTSSFNLRRKGRNHKGRKKLRPMGPLAELVSEPVGDIIVNKGDTTQSGDVYRYFAIRKKPVLRKHFFERKIIA